MAQRLKGVVINLFCIGEMGFNVMMAVAVNYYAYFLTDVAGIAAAAAGTILLIARICDAISVPVVGAVIERSNMKWGKYRSWILTAPFTTALFFILMFTNLPLNLVTKAAVLGTAYVCAHFSVNLGWSAYSALIPIMAVDPADRVLLSSRRAQTMAAAQLVFGLAAMPLILALGAGNEARGFFMTVTIFAVLQVLGYLLVAQVVKPFDSVPRVEGKREGVSLRGMLAQVFANPPLLVIMLAQIVGGVGMFALPALVVYYFKYVAQNMLMITAFFTAMSIAALGGAVLGQLIGQRVAKKTTYIIGMLISVAGLLSAWLFARDPVTFIALCSIAALGGNIPMAVGAAIYADIVDYGEWRTGKSAAGLIMALSALPIKIAVALAGGLTGYALAAIGYAPNMEPTAELARAITFLVTLVPALFSGLTAVCMVFYPLSEERVRRMRFEIEERRSGSAQQVA